MFKSLSGLFSTAPAFPYIIDEPYDIAWGEEGMWTHYRGRTKVGPMYTLTFNSTGGIVPIKISCNRVINTTPYMHG